DAAGARAARPGPSGGGVRRSVGGVRGGCLNGCRSNRCAAAGPEVIGADLAPVLELVGADDHVVRERRRRPRLELFAPVAKADDEGEEAADADEDDAELPRQLSLAGRLRPDVVDARTRSRHWVD